MNEAKEVGKPVEVGEIPTLIPTAGTLARVEHYIRLRKGFDGRELSPIYVLTEAVDKGVEGLIRSTENSIDLRNQKDYRNWCSNNPQPEMFMPDGTTLNKKFVEWSRNDAAQKRRFGIGGTQKAV